LGPTFFGLPKVVWRISFLLSFCRAVVHTVKLRRRRSLAQLTVYINSLVFHVQRLLPSACLFWVRVRPSC